MLDTMLGTARDARIAGDYEGVAGVYLLAFYRNGAHVPYGVGRYGQALHYIGFPVLSPRARIVQYERGPRLCYQSQPSKPRAGISSVGLRVLYPAPPLASASHHRGAPMTSTPAYIYTLCEPDTGDVRYVGKTKDPYHRFYHHIAESDARSHRNPYKSRWIQKLRRQGKRPLIQIIEETNEESWQERERYWIAFYCEKGARLTNIQPGGEGGLSPQSAAKLAESMRGHPVSPATREKLRRANLGKKHTAETVATMRSVRTGVAHSAEWGERISATKLERYAAVLAERGTFTCGHPFTPENTYTWTHIDRRSAYGRTRIEYECRECKKERRKRRKRERERTQGGMPTC